MSQTVPTASPPPAGIPTPLDATYRRITWRLLPFLMGLWILSWIDRVNIGFAKLQMLADLRFSETVYGIGAGIFFLGYFLCEVPSNLLLEYIGARRTIARITFLWGACCVAMMFVTTPAGFYVLRFLLGVFEAGFYPGVILFLTYWYPTPRRARVFGLFMSASALAGVIGGPLAGAIMTGLDGVNGWSGWQWVFLLEGIPSILAGLVTLLYLTDRPAKATWLTAEQRALVEADLARDAAALGPREHRILACLGDARVWQCIAIFFCIVTANSALTFFGPSVVREAGFTDPLTIGWIMSGAYLCGGAGMILNGLHSDRTGESRLHCGVPALVGAVAIAVLGFLVPVSPGLAIVALTVAIVGTMSAIPVFWQIPGRFLAGSAAAAGIALINSVANLAGFGAPAAMGYLREHTGSVSTGLWIVAAVECAALVLILAFVPPETPTAQPRAVTA
ncbi:MAG: MFS transporter [Methylobacterium sp.]|uniref:MFS transporter n=1 Tax=unclassified Methylobacterium TaxID=2615210 RepID=UPI0011C88547|nr:MULTISPECIES: MFS transporter [unclassified Methylobacterium]MDO9428341.1 MFS transporter [Methylobacterium sp.]TXM79144.1 MFS transporter [Methylobacterium sp. WL69]